MLRLAVGDTAGHCCLNYMMTLRLLVSIRTTRRSAQPGTALAMIPGFQLSQAISDTSHGFYPQNYMVRYPESFLTWGYRPIRLLKPAAVSHSGKKVRWICAWVI